MITIFHPRQLYGVPRLDRLYRQASIRWRPLQVDTDAIRQVLSRYGYSIEGKIVAAGAGRSNSLIVQTNAGIKLVKRYKATLDPATIRHEHSILRYLTQVDVPAPRLCVAADGATLVQHEDRCWALSEYLDGYFHYHNYVFWPGQTRQFVAAAGQALGALHTALQGFTPEGYHPNGFTSLMGRRWRDIDWYMEQLAWCREQASGREAENTPVLQRMLRQHADTVEATLYHLNERLGAAGLSRTIIHGDYGPYNVLFKRGAPVVIVDFELARLDWQLADLATAFQWFARSRLGFNVLKMQWLLDAYRTTCPIDGTELQLLPDVWQFLALRRVIVCWQRACDTYGDRWLTEAQQKLDLTQWIAHHHHLLAELASQD